MNDPDIKNEGLKFKIFDNEKSLEEFIYRDQYGRILCGVVFYDDYLNYSIRIKGKEIVDSNANPIMDISKNVESDYRAGYESVFLYIQVAIDNAIIQMKSNNTVNGLSLLVGEIPKSDYYYSSKNIRTFDGLAPFVMLLCIGQFLHISNRLMDEIKDRTKEGLISIGTNSFHLWFTWEKAKTVTILLCVFVVSMISVNKLIFDMKINGNEKIEKILSAIISPIGVSMGSEEILHQGKKEQYIGFSNL
ncbi:hypothetical protein PIROE2DRAFT_13780 [Piromyces sp. E2]|nr:hypothetical protein PIROE2DRAFT_13780 [Piromyces sp. E2]|eukprot:OUM60432.1 hypothetical protein PIROE2DRAFT_13780 [Piromyces sp. E2]